MKNFLLIFFLFNFFYSANAQLVNEIRKTTDINSIVVYLDGAEITQEAVVSLKQGRNLIVFEGLSPSLDSKSIRVSTQEDISVLAISSKINYLTKIEEKPRIKQIRDSIDLLTNNINILTNEKTAFESERTMILANQNIGGEDNGLTIDELKKAADFFRLRLTEINNNITEIDRKILKMNLLLENCNSELLELNANLNYQRAEISILLESPSVSTETIEIKYIVKNAGWTPVYDIRAEDLGKDIELIYRAKVFNNTNIDWNNVKLILSTGDPNLSAAKPEMRTWFLDYSSNSYSNNSPLYLDEGYMQNNVVSSEYQEYDRQEIISDGLTGGEDGRFVEVSIAELSAEFEITENYSIPADNKPYLVDVVEYNLPATYQHFSVPKIDRDAFLLARITGWEDLNLVEGNANIYFGGTYVGQSYISTRNVRDTLDISLGRDNKVLVTRSKLNEYSSVRFIGSNRKETLAYEMIVKNNRQTPVFIHILDQLPISQNSEIEVEAIELSNAIQDLATGELLWQFQLNSGESKRILLTFSIKYPKNHSIQIQQQRSKMMRVY